MATAPPPGASGPLRPPAHGDALAVHLAQATERAHAQRAAAARSATWLAAKTGELAARTALAGRAVALGVARALRPAPMGASVKAGADGNAAQARPWTAPATSPTAAAHGDGAAAAASFAVRQPSPSFAAALAQLGGARLAPLGSVDAAQQAAWRDAQRAAAASQARPFAASPAATARAAAPPTTLATYAAPPDVLAPPAPPSRLFASAWAPRWPWRTPGRDHDHGAEARRQLLARVQAQTAAPFLSRARLRQGLAEVGDTEEMLDRAALSEVDEPLVAAPSAHVLASLAQAPSGGRGWRRGGMWPAFWSLWRWRRRRSPRRRGSDGERRKATDP